jgi:hypothetical protein
MIGTIQKRHFRSLLFLTSSVWLIWIAGKYSQLIDSLPANLLETTFVNLNQLFFGQFAAFLLLLATYLVKHLDKVRGWLNLSFFSLSVLYVLSIPGKLGFMIQVILFLLWWFSASLAVRSILRKVSPRIATFGLAAGCLIAGLIPVWFFLGFFGIFNIWTVGFIAIFLVIYGLWVAKQDVILICRDVLKKSSQVNAIGFASLEGIFILLTIVFIWSNSPEAGSDAARSHLPLAQNYANSGSIHQYFVNWGRFMPKAAQTWSAAAIILGGVQVSKWLSWFYLFTGGLLIGEEMFRRTRSRNFSIFSVIVVLTCPMLTYLATTLYIDHLILLLNLTALFLVFRSQGDNQIRILVLSAFVMGGLAQIKYNTLLFAMVWSVTVVWYLLASRKFSKAIQGCMVVAIVFLASCLPWYLYTYMNTGNPVFPYFDQFFDSPLWPSDIKTTLGQDKYYLGDSWVSALKFPWIVTFFTTQISNRHNGMMGYWMLGLIPFCLFGINRRWIRSGLDLTLTGAVGIGLVCISTLNSRYWLPAYPLLIGGLLLGAFELFEATKIRIQRDLMAAGSLILLAMVFITIPFWTAFNHFGLFTWEVYSGAKTEQEWLNFLYPGTPAVTRLNQFMDTDDGVLCTDYEAVFALNGRAYEFPFWHTNILQLKSGDALADFIEKNKIHYWLMNFKLTDENHFINGRFDAEERFWTDRRLVAVSHQVAIFNVTGNKDRGELLEYEVLNPRMQVCNPSDGIDCWRSSQPEKQSSVTDATTENIGIPASSNIRRVFEIPEESTLVEFSIRAKAKKRTTLILSLEWLDKNGRQFGLVQGGLTSTRKFDLFKGPIYGNIPPGAEKVSIRIRPWRSDVIVFDPKVRFLGYAETGKTN